MSAEKAKLRAALNRIAEAQAEFWEAMHDFETLADIEIDDSSTDFSGYEDPTDGDVQAFIAMVTGEDESEND